MDNVEIVRRVEELWNADKIDELDQYFADDFQNPSGVPMLPPGLEGAKMAHAGSLQSFPDRNVEILDIFGSGDKVCVRSRITGTNKGGIGFFGVAEGNDKQIDFEFIGIYQLRDGKIVKHWAVNDALTGAIQVGGFTPIMG